MPLRAIIHGSDVVACLLDEAAWNTLKAQTRSKSVEPVLPCGHRAICKTSSLGTQFFAHVGSQAGPSCGAGETKEHLLLKSLVVKIAVEMGWTAVPEVPGEGWRADVMLERQGERRVIEVQWSHQEDVDFRFRQDRYTQAGLECVWLYRVPRDRHLPYGLREPPVLSVSVTSDGDAVCHSGERRPLEQVLKWLLSDELRWRSTTVAGAAGTATVKIYRRPCYQCKTWMVLWYVPEVEVRCDCELLTFNLHPDLFVPKRPETSPTVTQLVAETTKDWNTPKATLDMRYTRTSGVHYMAFVCPNCSAVMGEHHMSEGVWGYKPQRTATVRRGSQARPHPHWCGTHGPDVD